MRHIKRSTWILCAIWAVIVVAVAAYTNISKTDKSTYTATSDSISFNGKTYVSDNSNGFGVIYRLSTEGETEKTYVNHRRKYVSDWKVAKLASENVDGTVGGSVYGLMVGKETSTGKIPYRIASFTTDLVTEAMSTTFYLHGGLTVTGFSADEGILYITGVSKSRQDVYVYRYDKYSLIQFEGMTNTQKASLAGEAEELSEMSKERSSSGGIYTDAEYAEGMLYTRMDDQEASEYFAEDTDVKNLFDTRSESIFENLKAGGMSIVDIFAYIIFGCAIIVALSLILAHRRRIVYRIIFIEALFVAITVFAFLICAHINHKAAEREFMRNEVYSLSLLGSSAPKDIGTDDFFASSEYETFYTNMNTVADRSDEMAKIKDIALVDSISGKILMSTSGYGGGSVSYVYGDTARSLVTGPESISDATGNLDGNDVHFVCVGVTGAPQYRLLCVANLLSVMEYVLVFQMQLPIILIIFFFIASTAAVALINYETVSLERVGEALEKLGAGEGNVDIPNEPLGYDIKRMWASINEIEKNLKKAGREKFLTYEAYFRFAPKKIEKIIGKDDITEVQIGDTKRINGTVAIIENGRDEKLDEVNLKKRNSFFEVVEKCSEANNGIFISAEDDLTTMKVLFLENDKESIRFGTDLSRDRISNNGSFNETLLLHYESFLYGVFGTKDQAITFLSAKDITALEDYTRWLGDLGVSMVVTESVKERETGPWDFRYIGFILPDENDKSRRINLYEVLDASNAEIRRGKKKTMDAFQSALDMFYEKDFYFARNAFTDILHEVPQDEIAKWYLFECERLLNGIAEPDFIGELHLDRA